MNSPLSFGLIPLSCQRASVSTFAEAVVFLFSITRLMNGAWMLIREFLLTMTMHLRRLGFSNT